MVNDITAEFHKACINGELERVSKLLYNKEEIDVAYLNDEITLCTTVEKSHVEIVKILLEIGVNANQIDLNKRTPLHHAKSLSIAKMLLENGANVDPQDYHGETPLHKACKNGRVEVVQLLIKHNAGVNKQNRLGETPLHVASKYNTTSSIVKMLLENGAYVDTRDFGNGCNGRTGTALHEACDNGNLEIVQTLFQHHADVNALNDYGEIPLHQACLKGHLKIVQMLLKHSSKVNIKARFDETPLHEACHAGSLEIVQELIKHKADVNAVFNGPFGLRTPLLVAVENGFSEIVEELLKHGADINFSDDNVNAFHLAIEDGHVEVVKKLLINGCNPKVRAQALYVIDELPNCTAFELALHLRSFDIMKMVAFHVT